MRLQLSPRATGSERLGFARGAQAPREIRIGPPKDGFTVANFRSLIFGTRGCAGGNELRATTSTERAIMLWTIFVILLILWLLGFVGFHVLGAYIHILLLIALVVLILQLIGGRRPL